MLQLLASALAALALSAAVYGQTPSAAHHVQRHAPHLMAFAGSAENLESLAAGLAHAQPITLTTVGSDGLIQTVTFVPPATVPPAEIPRVLEAARQTLIVYGIAHPGARQLAVALVGGTLVTASTTAALPGLLGGRPVAVRVHTAFGPPPARESLRDALLQGALTGTPMSRFEANTALHLAALLLAHHGILAPTREQLELALLGGTMTGPTGTVVPVQGVLQGPPRHTSDSPYFGTSHSRVIGTSRTPPASAPAIPPRAPVSAPPAGALRSTPGITPRFGVAR
jgi:hypothetical protein